MYRMERRSRGSCDPSACPSSSERARMSSPCPTGSCPDSLNLRDSVLSTQIQISEPDHHHSQVCSRKSSCNFNCQGPEDFCLSHRHRQIIDVSHYYIEVTNSRVACANLPPLPDRWASREHGIGAQRSGTDVVRWLSIPGRGEGEGGCLPCGGSIDVYLAVGNLLSVLPGSRAGQGSLSARCVSLYVLTYRTAHFQTYVHMQAAVWRAETFLHVECSVRHA